ncbi:MAG: hypothetical protein JWQ54_3796 [Mucilaginibacter sp.]|nr:hypothetical protein [Mucilaginibacter sp.]
MPKYRFRKMYFICENKQVIQPNIWATTAHQHKDKADDVLANMDKSVKMWDVNKPPITHSVEGFYLVHERLFDAILKEHAK